MAHAAKWKQRTDFDFSIDERFVVDQSLWRRDTYVKLTVAVYLAPKILALYLPLYLLQLPAMLAMKAFMVCPEVCTNE